MPDIKMSDMFAVDIQAKRIHIKGGYTYSKIDGMTTEEYAAHAINTHDSLVAQNNEYEEMLLNAFQMFKNNKGVGYLKFDEFKDLTRLKHDHNGDIEGKR